MTGIRTTAFRGMAPRFNKRRLGDNLAQVATNCKIGSGGLVPYYWFRHAIIALVISFACIYVPHSWTLLGAMFYIGREVRDREKLGVWDWPGLCAPVAASAGLWAAVYFGGLGVK
ncbi:MAG: hypothetical protein E6Q97_13080 [Desulfurellales bacterium]|nr:MAG: hypothetical protein E6Q97_13080 [Desulfurellales bacterium]